MGFLKIRFTKLLENLSIADKLSSSYRVSIFDSSIFLIYLAYKVSFSKTDQDILQKNPVKFFDTFLFQFINPKAIIVAMIMVSTFVDSNNNYMRESLWVIGVNFIFAWFSITFWTLLGKFVRKFATNHKFIKIFNYVMSFLLVSCIATFYL